MADREAQVHRHPSVPLWRLEVGERLTRLEAQIDSHEESSDQRSDAVVRALDRVVVRLDELEARQWKITAGLAVVGVSGGAGLLELVRWAVG
ncbi:MAG: hypothetical protein EP330_08555 [Deltaproteobacteria bacterium]|nr:MAG: hypothetical protein EP330_08555 [Deltaproteobacteria bacterium]